MNYILDGKTPVREPDHQKWAEWFGSNDRTVARTDVNTLLISTVFLAIDHSFGGGTPVLFETMVFDDYGEFERLDYSTTRRYHTWDEAVEGHNEVVADIEQWVTDCSNATIIPIKGITSID